MKTDPAHARARKGMAEVYRQLRRDNPAMARLLYRRIKLAERQIDELILGPVKGTMQ